MGKTLAEISTKKLERKAKKLKNQIDQAVVDNDGIGHQVYAAQLEKIENQLERRKFATVHPGLKKTGLDDVLTLLDGWFTDVDIA